MESIWFICKVEKCIIFIEAEEITRFLDYSATFFIYLVRVMERN